MLKKFFSYGIVGLLSVVLLTSWGLIKDEKFSQRKRESVSFVGDVSKVRRSSSATFEVAYVARKTREIIVEVWYKEKWLARETIIVKKGKGVKKVQFNFKKTLYPSRKYSLRIQLRPPNSTWKEAIVSHQVSPVEVR